MTLQNSASRHSGVTREGETLLRELVASLAQASWKIDAAGKTAEDSPSWRTHTGQTPSEWLANGWLGAVHPDEKDQAENLWRDALATKRKIDAEFRIRHSASGDYRWARILIIPITGSDGGVSRWIGLNIDVHDRKRAVEYERVLTTELQHRIRNILASMRSIVSRTLGNDEETEIYRAHLDGRIGSLARIQNLLTREPGRKADLEMLVRDELLAQAIPDERVNISGPKVRLSAKPAELIAMSIHELATNAIKYGALGDCTNTIKVHWSLEQKSSGDLWLTIDWVEKTARGDALSASEGFGTELITRRIPYELHGEGKLTFENGELRAQISIPHSETENAALPKN